MNKRKTVLGAVGVIAVALSAFYLWWPMRSNSDLNSGAAVSGDVGVASASIPANSDSLRKVESARVPSAQSSEKGVGQASRDAAPPNPVYQSLDSQLKDNIAVPTWFYTDRDLYAEVARMDSNATVGEVKCGESLCRFIVQHQTAADREHFAKRGLEARAELSERLFAGANPAVPARVQEGREIANEPVKKAPSLGTTTIYRYPKEDPAETIVYVMKMDSSADIRDQVAGMMQNSP